MIVTEMKKLTRHCSDPVLVGLVVTTLTESLQVGWEATKER